MADMMAKEGDRPMDKFAWFYKVSATSSQSTSGSQSSRHTVWMFEITATWNFIKDQSQFIYLFIVLLETTPDCFASP